MAPKLQTAALSCHPAFSSCTSEPFQPPPSPSPRAAASSPGICHSSVLSSQHQFLSELGPLQQSTAGRGLIDTRHSFLTVPEAGTSEIRLTPGRGLVSALFWSTDGHLTEFSRGRGREREEGMEGRRKGRGRRQSSLSGVPVIRVPLHHQSPLRTWSPPKCPTSKHHYIGG